LTENKEKNKLLFFPKFLNFFQLNFQNKILTSDKKTAGPTVDSTTPFFTKTSESKLLISKKEINNSEISKPVSQNSVESENALFLKETISSNSFDNIVSSSKDRFLSNELVNGSFENNEQKDNKKFNFYANFRNDIS